MKPKKTINELLNSAAAFESKTELWSEDELRSLLANAPLSEQPAPTPPSRVQPNPIQWRNIMIGTTIFSGAAAALLWFTSLPENNVATTLHQKPDAVAKLNTHADNAVATSAEQRPSSSEKANISSAVLPLAIAAQKQASNTSQAYTTTQEVPVAPAKSVSIPTRIRNLNVLALSNTELARLGIRSTAQGYSTTAVLRFSSERPEALNVFMANAKINKQQSTLTKNKLTSVAKQFGYQNPDNALLKFRVAIDELDIAATMLSNDDSTTAIAPLLITHESKDANGTESDRVLIFSATPEQTANHPRLADELDALYSLRSATPQMRTEVQIQPQRFPLLSKLVAVQVHRQEIGSGEATALLWYYPDEAFLAALPPEKADAIRKEINALESYEKNHNDTTGTLLGNGGLKGDYSYTDAARARGGAIEILAVGPNPADQITTLRFMLDSERTIAVALYDINGMQVMQLAAEQSYLRGESSIALNLGSLSSGAYFISILSNRGEQATQRLIIQH